MIGAPTAGTAQRVNNPHLKHYRVFISHAGSGIRCLKPKSIVLMEDISSKVGDFCQLSPIVTRDYGR